MAKAFSLLLSDGTYHPYQIVPSKRAKYIRIKLSQRGDLSVTLPAFTQSDHAHDFVHSKREWIEKNLLKVSVTEERFPEVLDLTLLNEVWSVSYVETDTLNNSLKLIEKDEFVLEIQGPNKGLKDLPTIVTVLNNWCKRKAKKAFNQMLQELAELHGFHYQRLSIRSQKTRWGSCSHKKNINLNCKLLFMPEEVVKYVMIHELCHTIEMNHSARFWNLVEECDPKYKKNRNELKSLGKMIVI